MLLCAFVSWQLRYVFINEVQWRKMNDSTYMYEKGGDVLELRFVSCVDASTGMSSSLWFLLAKSDIRGCSLLLKSISVEEDIIGLATMLTDMHDTCA